LNSIEVDEDYLTWVIHESRFKKKISLKVNKGIGSFYE